MGERHRQRITNIKSANVAISTLHPINQSNKAIKTNTRNLAKYLHKTKKHERRVQKN